jgi:serine/threonine protein kinase
MAELEDDTTLPRDKESAGAARRLGQLVADKWTIDGVLGEGGMSTVYAATHRNGHRVALKVLSLELTRSPALVKRFVREAYLSNKVPHDGTVRVLDDGFFADGTPFLVLERLDGHSLDVHTRNGQPMDMQRAVQVMRALLSILEAAHGVGLVHRDIKPANVFRTRRGEIRLLDFGIALVTDAAEDDARTKTGAILGTPAFMAPEQARGRRELVGPATDLWAVGATGLSLMLGRRLRDATTASEELAMAALQPLPPAYTFGGGLAGPLGDVFDRALAFEPGQRFASAREMNDALAECEPDVPEMELDSVSRPATERMRAAETGSSGAVSGQPAWRGPSSSSSAEELADTVASSPTAPRSPAPLSPGEAAALSSAPVTERATSTRSARIKTGEPRSTSLVVALVVVATGLVVALMSMAISASRRDGPSTSAPTAAAASLTHAASGTGAPTGSPARATSAPTSATRPPPTASSSASPTQPASPTRPGSHSTPPLPPRHRPAAGASSTKPDFMDEP